MPELFVVHEFKRCCLIAIGLMPITCIIYFNPKVFREGKRRTTPYGGEIQDCIIYDPDMKNLFQKVIIVFFTSKF